MPSKTGKALRWLTSQVELILMRQRRNSWKTEDWLIKRRGKVQRCLEQRTKTELCLFPQWNSGTTSSLSSPKRRHPFPLRGRQQPWLCYTEMACLPFTSSRGGRPEPVPTRSPTTLGLRVQVIRFLAISLEPANKPENTLSPSPGGRKEIYGEGGQ